MFAIVITVLIATAGMEGPPSAMPGNELDRYLAETAASHPALQRRHEEWLAALARIPQATGLDDPMLTYAQFVQADMERARIGLMQKFPWFGTLRTRGSQAAAEAEAVLSQFHAERDSLFYQVKRAYYEYALLAERTHIVEAQAEVIAYVGDIVEAKLALGLATDDELMRVSIAKTELDDRYTSLGQLRPTLSRQLAAAVGRVEHALLPWPEETPVPFDPPPAPIISARIRQANPNLQALDHRITAFEYQEELARKRGLPDFSVGVDYTFMRDPPKMEAALPSIDMDDVSSSSMFETAPESEEREDEIMISLSVNVPIWRKKIRGGIDEARHLQTAAGHEQRARFLELESMAQMVRFEMQDAARRYRLFEESLTPQAEMTFESLQGRYAADSAGKTFLDILESVQQLLDFQLEQAMSRTRWQQAAAELEMLMGGSLAELSRNTPEVSEAE
jgi:outer membrane protein TolC